MLVGVLPVAALLLVPLAGGMLHAGGNRQNSPDESVSVSLAAAATSSSLTTWINQAVEILKAAGYPASKMNPADIQTIIMHESGGNPFAINKWDANWSRGYPSKGLMQVIDPTFRTWALPGYNDIWNPVHNIVAAVRYSIGRYGSVSNVPGVVAVRHGSRYRGY